MHVGEVSVVCASLAVREQTYPSAPVPPSKAESSAVNVTVTGPVTKESSSFIVPISRSVAGVDTDNVALPAGAVYPYPRVNLDARGK